MPRNSFAAVAALCAVLGVTIALYARSQTAPAGPLAPAPGVQPQLAPATLQNGRALHVQSSEVLAPVTVTDKSGEMILNLKQEDFHIFDDGVEQPIGHFGLGGDPLAIVLVAETSQRIELLLPAIRRSGIVFAQPVLGQTAEAAIVGYDRSVRLLENFSKDADALQKTVNDLETGNDGAHLYDAMARGISLLEERPEGERRILLVVGEAQDTGSERKLGEVLRMAQQANVAIYSVGLSTTKAALKRPPPDSGPAIPPVPTGNQRTDEMNRQMQGQMAGGGDMALVIWLLETGKNAVGKNALAVASRSTGGLHVNTFKDRAIENAMDAIGGELHAQYTVGYQASQDKQGSYHEIRVTVDRPGATVRTRPGYYLAQPGS